MDLLGPKGEWIGLAIVATAFFAFAAIEWLAPMRRGHLPKARRWTTNLVLFVLDTVLVRVTIPLLMIGTAALAQERGWGMLNLVELPQWVGVVLALAALDLALYLQHWATHRVPMLWRLHRVHHSDPDFDVTTAARFHPIEIVLSMLYKMAVVALLGAPVLAVFLFEMLFTVLTLFTHANFSLPPRIDRAVRRVLVTPDMHRIHHSTVPAETDSNYGTVLTLWDRLFRTYTAQPVAGREGLAIGLDAYQDARPARLGWSLLLPFRD